MDTLNNLLYGKEYSDSLRNGKIIFDKELVCSNIFSPYIKLEALKLINTSNSIKQIVVAWHIEDLVKGVSDLELYQYCKENNIILYRNTRIHLKVLWDGNNNLILGSSNITHKGLGLVPNHNFELNALYNNIDFKTKSYLENIINESELVTDELYDKIKNIVNTYDEKVFKIEDLPSVKKEKDYFRLSELPQSYSPDYFIEVLSNPNNYSEADQKCALMDISTFEVQIMNGEINELKLAEKFNTHPFIISFKSHIKSKGSERYGGCVNWIRDNCTEVPIPRSFELKDDSIVNILYRWVCFFDPDFEIIRPNYSEVIRYKKNIL